MTAIDASRAATDPAEVPADEALARREQLEFRDRLLSAGVLVGNGLEGGYAHSEAFERVVAGVRRRVSAAAAADGEATRLRLPAVMPRTLLERTNYLTTFPQLMGSVHTFRGSSREHAELVALAAAGGDWGRGLAATTAVLCPAACQQVYPMCGSWVPGEGRRFDVLGQCFRAEPSPDPARMQYFRMHEQVFVGHPADAVAHRDRWLQRAQDLLTGLGLQVGAEPANDPFFGRLSTVLATGQRSKQLKFEVVGTVGSASRPTALASANYHEDHFGTTFAISTPDGQTAHTACVGFGLERVALALFAAHGLQLRDWPAEVRAALPEQW